MVYLAAAAVHGGAEQRGNGEGRRDVGGPVAHQERGEGHGKAGGGPTARRRCTTTMAGGGEVGSDSRDRRQLRAPRPDSTGGEVQHVGTELGATTACAGAAGIDGGATIAAAADRAAARVTGGEERAAQGSGMLLSSSWREGAGRGVRGGGHGDGMARAAAVLSLWRQEDEPFLENPLATFKIIAERSLAVFRNLKGAPGPFDKFQKNSYKLGLTLRPSTKFGEAIQNVLHHIYS